MRRSINQCPRCGQENATPLPASKAGKPGSDAVSGRGSHALLFSLAILCLFALVGAVLATAILLFGPRDAASLPRLDSLILAYVVFAIASLIGAAVAWGSQAIGKKTPPSVDVFSELTCASCGHSWKSDGAAGERPFLHKAPIEATPSTNSTNLGTSSLRRRFVEPLIPSNVVQPSTPVPSENVQGKRATRRVSAFLDNIKPKPQNPPTASKTVASNATPRCRHGKRRGYCALCDPSAFKDMFGRWEED